MNKSNAAGQVNAAEPATQESSRMSDLPAPAAPNSPPQAEPAGVSGSITFRTADLRKKTPSIGTLPADGEPTTLELAAFLEYVASYYHEGNEGKGKMLAAAAQLRRLEAALAKMSDLPAPAAPDGYAVRMADGPYVGIWQDREIAEHICAQQPPGHGDRVVPMYIAPNSPPQATESPSASRPAHGDATTGSREEPSGHGDIAPEGDAPVLQASLEAALAKAREEERERCAKLVDPIPGPEPRDWHEYRAIQRTREALARAIRALRNEEKP